MNYRIKLAKELSSILISIRKAKKLNQTELGELLGLSQRTVAQFESKPEKASFDRVLKVANALDMDIVLTERTNENKLSNSDTGDSW
ncbi:hypothetical protein MNBD_GAMMA07-861 [hydrothermal vent metagenome]|uniref:HTH cro/C1-type domain-containing protein n=1 Tax=hydrothermal vent metagenome TaxID=652676 RepID=A0A3B0WMN8_9ZZZZ